MPWYLSAGSDTRKHDLLPNVEGWHSYSRPIRIEHFSARVIENVTIDVKYLQTIIKIETIQVILSCM